MVTPQGKPRREIFMAKKAFNTKIPLLTSKSSIELRGENCPGVIFETLHFVWLRNLDNKKTGKKVFRELPNVVLEENGEDKMLRENIKLKFSSTYSIEEDVPK